MFPVAGDAVQEELSRCGARGCHGSTSTELRRLLTQLTGTTGTLSEQAAGSDLLISGTEDRQEEGEARHAERGAAAGELRVELKICAEARCHVGGRGGGDGLNPGNIDIPCVFFFSSSFILPLFMFFMLHLRFCCGFKAG